MSGVPAAIRTCQEYPRVTRTLGTDLREHRMRQNESTNAQQEGVQMTHLREVKMTEVVQAVKRTPWERQGALRMSGSG